MVVYGNKKQDIVNMKFLIKINSISNAITNSSSEVFLVKTKRPSKEIKKLILDFGKIAKRCDGDNCTGKMNLEDLSHCSQEIIKEDELTFPTNGEYEGGSGMGMELNVYDYEDAKREYEKHHGKDFGDILKEKGITEEIDHYVFIDLDKERGKTISFIKDNFDYYQEETDRWNEECDNVYDILSWASEYNVF